MVGKNNHCIQMYTCIIIHLQLTKYKILCMHLREILDFNWYCKKYAYHHQLLNKMFLFTKCEMYITLREMFVKNTELIRPNLYLNSGILLALDCIKIIGDEPSASDWNLLFCYQHNIKTYPLWSQVIIINNLVTIIQYTCGKATNCNFLCFMFYNMNLKPNFTV